ncbi:unnamed protein product [Urochloa decumbens]|uniref:pectinesterase n=1 Tax=Urochloa decumbens TaxID=240449 RepID=A0ABC9ER67_9POAL
MQPPFGFSSSLSSLPVVLLLLLLLWLSTPSLAWAPVSRTITVDRQGRGDFSTVQSAVDAVPDGNRDWIKIHVNAGSYWEKVTIPQSKGYILLEGDGSSTTDISFDATAHAGIDQIMSESPGSLPRSAAPPSPLSPTTSSPGTSPSRRTRRWRRWWAGTRARSTGASSTGSRTRSATSWGGYGQSIYEDCVLMSTMPPGPQPGWVTAHARLGPGSPGGLVFKGGAVVGTGRIYLGRAWNGFATAVFYGTRMDDVVVPQGWQAWNAGNDVSQVTFAEVGCSGPGSVMSRREGWEKHMSDEELKRFVDIKFIDDGWLSAQP